LFFFGAETPLVHGAFTSLDFLQNLVQWVQRQPLVPIHGIHSFFCLLDAFAASKEVWEWSYALTASYNWEGVRVTARLPARLERLRCINGGEGWKWKLFLTAFSTFNIFMSRNLSHPRRRKIVIIIWFWYHYVSLFLIPRAPQTTNTLSKSLSLNHH
jgi:hypothetical protein